MPEENSIIEEVIPTHQDDLEGTSVPTINENLINQEVEGDAPHIDSPPLEAEPNKDTKVRLDEFDRSRKNYEYFYGMSSVAFVLGGTLVAEGISAKMAGDTRERYLDTVSSAVAVQTFFAPLIGMATNLFLSHTKYPNIPYLDLTYKEPNALEVQDPYLGTVADYYVTRKKWTPTPGIDLAKGDNLCIVWPWAIPDFTNENEPPKSMHGEYVDKNPPLTENTLEVMEQSFKAVAADIKNRDVKAVMVPPYAGEALGLESRKFTSLQDFMKMKDNVKKDAMEVDFITLTKEEFLALMESPAEAFEKAVMVVDDGSLAELLRLYKSASVVSERQDILDMIGSKIDGVLYREAEIMFNGPERVTTGFNQKTGVKDVSRTYPISSIVQRSQSAGNPRNNLEEHGGYFFVNFTSETGEENARPLAQLLKMGTQGIDEILKSDSNYKNAQLCYLVRKMLDDDIEKLLKKPEDNKPPLALNEAERQAYGWRDPIRKNITELISSNLRRGLSLRTLLPIVLYSSFLTGEKVLDAVKLVTDKIESNSKVASPYFNEGIPESHLDWQITSLGGMPKDGYFIESTSRVFNDGKWEVEDTRIKEIAVPQSVDSNIPTLEMKSFIMPALSGPTTIKLPLLAEKGLGALEITTSSGEPVDYKTYLIKDGTVQVVIEPDRNVAQGNRGVYEVFMDLVELKYGVEGVGPKATEKIDPVNKKALSDKALKLNDGFQKAEKWSTSYEQYAANYFSQNYKYSLNSSGAENIRNAKTPEAYLNEVLKLTECQCSVCNSASAILSSLDVENSSYINIAMGYGNFKGHFGSPHAGDFLRSDAKHMFQIDNLGSIIDATARELSDDEMTLKYESQISSANVGAVSPQEKWEAQSKELIGASDKLANLVQNVKTALELGAGLGGIFLAAQSAILMKRLSKNEEFKSRVGDVLQTTRDKMLLGMYTEDEFLKYYHFLTKMSFGNLAGNKNIEIESLTKSNPLLDKGNAELLVRMRTAGVNYEKLALYLASKNEKHPGRYTRAERATIKQMEGLENGFNFSNLEKTKLRLLSEYLFNGY